VKRWTTILAACALAASLGLIGSVGAAPGNKYPSATQEHECDDEGEHLLQLVGAPKLWPPNHKYQDYTLKAIGHEGDEIMLEFEGAHEEVDENGDEMNGAGNTDTDVNPPAGMDTDTGEVSIPLQMRAERSGRGDGRTYDILATAEFSDGTEPCIHTFQVQVPHDMRGGRDW
jgi:hypothetical protein